MKTLLSVSLSLLLGLGVFGCKQATQPMAADGPALHTSPGGSSTPAHPAIVYNHYNGKANEIEVMDSDGSHQTTLLSGNGAFGWSPGSSILMSGNSDSLYAADVSVNSNGVPVASNTRVIVSKSYRTTDSTVITGPASWSATSSVDKIAFTIRNIHKYATSNGIFSICTQSASGGSWDTLHTFPPHDFVEGITWKADDSKIAVLLDSIATGSFSVVIFDASTGATTDSIPLPYNAAGWSNLAWSHGSSVNLLALTRDTATPGRLENGGYLCYLTPSAGSSPTTQNVATQVQSQYAGDLTWSPSGANLIFATAGVSNTNKCGTCGGTQGIEFKQTLYRLTEQSTSKSNLQSQTNCCYQTWSGMDWHR